MRKELFFTTLLLGCMTMLSGFEILLPPNDGTCGVRTYSADDDTWRSDLIFNDAPHSLADYQEVGTDFFLHEYGLPLDFSKGDMLRKIGAQVRGSYKITGSSLEIEPGKDFSFTVGKDPAHREKDSIRFSEHWGKMPYAQWYVVMELNQDADSSDWEVPRYNMDGFRSSVRKFTVKGKGSRHVRIACGKAHGVNSPIAGIGLLCRNPKGKIRISKIEFKPLMGNVYYRKSFDLPFDPVGAKLSLLLNSLADYDLYINGKNIARPTKNQRSVQVDNHEISGLLKRGRNTIAIRNRYTAIWRYIAGHEPPNRIMLDLFLFGKDGKSQFLGSDPTWKTTFHPENGWWKTTFNDSAWKNSVKGEKLTRLANGKKIAMGLNPQHMGFLTVKPLGNKYPIFDADAKTGRGFSVILPAGLKNAEIRGKIEHTSKKYSEELVPGKTVEKKGFRETGFTFRSSLPGAYRVIWTLNAEGISEQREDELILVGKIDQDLFEYKDFEREFRKRLEKIQTIDAKKEQTVGPDFTTRTARHMKNKEHVKTFVVRKNGVAFRTMNAPGGSWMGWKIHTPELGEPYYLEIDVPDVDDRTVNAAVFHAVPVATDNSQWPLGSSAQIDATASVTTGGIQKNSNGIKTLTMVFHAANRISTVLLTHPHESPNPAAVSEIRLYRVKGGLPGMIVPETKREIMEHHERFTTWQTLASCSNVLEKGTFHPYHAHKNGWRNWYEGIERKIRQLRFQGQNASIEGMMMYDRTHYPSKNLRNATDRGEEFDVPYLLAKMYAKNGISCYFGWEVNRLDSILQNGVEKGISDRKIRKGEARGIYSINRKGIQNQRYSSSGVNMLAPGVWEDFMAAVKDVYDRYSEIPDVKGLFLAHGFYWLPGFLSLNSGDSRDVGFDDDSIELFEKMTGIRLNTPVSDPDRFEKRYQLLNGKYKKEYYAWREKIMTQKFREIRDLLQSGKHPWTLALSLNFSHQSGDRNSPFIRKNATRPERDNYMKNRIAEDGESTKLAKEPGMTWFLPLGINPEYKWGSPEKQRLWSAVLTNRGTQKLVGEANAVYSAYMLSEMPIHADTPNGKWYWKSNSAMCTYQRPAGKAAYLRELQICKEHVPRSLVIAGIDCHPYTGQAEECRRFAQAFYSVPERSFLPAESVQGVDARLAGEYLRLYNDSPYELTGFVRASSPFRELVYGRRAAKKMDLTIPPYAMLVFKGEASGLHYQGAFQPPKDATEELKSLAEYLLGNADALKKIPSDCLNRIRNALKNADSNAYELFNALNDSEVKGIADSAIHGIAGLVRQKAMIRELQTKGRVRFILAHPENYTDLDGNVWFGDQRWTDMGAYGNEYGNSADRGNAMQIKNTRAPRVYQTECNGSEVYFHIPLPDGVYDVVIHSAETWDNKGRSFTAECGGKELKDINPLRNGFATPWTGTMTGVKPDEGLLSIRFHGGAVAVSGIEIIRK